MLGAPCFKMLVAGDTQYSSIRDAASAGEGVGALGGNAPQPLPLVFLTRRISSFVYKAIYFRDKTACG